MGGSDSTVILAGESNFVNHILKKQTNKVQVEYKQNNNEEHLLKQIPMPESKAHWTKQEDYNNSYCNCLLLLILILRDYL